MDICAATSSSEKNGIKVRSTIHSKSQKDKKLAKSKKTKAFKRASSNSGSKATLIRRASNYLFSLENGSTLPSTPSSSSDRVGNEAQESSNPHTKRENSTKQSISNRHPRVVREGIKGSMEEFIPNHPSQPQNGGSCIWASSLGLNTQSVVEVSYRYPPDNRERCKGLEQAKKAIGSASIGRIKMVGAEEESYRHIRGIVLSKS